MKCTRVILNLAVAAALLWSPGAVFAQSKAETLLADLQRPENEGWRRTERQLLEEWSKSGSAALDLLLKRGRDALRGGENDIAIGHLTALTDHAPEFAEGYNSRASAWFRAGRYGPAVADLQRALELNPQHFGALAGIGAILEETGQKPAALRAYRAALAIHPRQDDVKKAAERLESQLSGEKL